MAPPKASGPSPCRWHAGTAPASSTVRSTDQLDVARALGADHAFLAADPDLAHKLRTLAPQGIHRIADVDFADHIQLDAQVLAVGGVISSYYSSDPQPRIPYWELGFADITLRLLGSDDFHPQVKAQAASALTEALIEGDLRVPILARLPLEEIAQAHHLVEQSARSRVVLQL